MHLPIQFIISVSYHTHASFFLEIISFVSFSFIFASSTQFYVVAYCAYDFCIVSTRFSNSHLPSLSSPTLPFGTKIIKLVQYQLLPTLFFQFYLQIFSFSIFHFQLQPFTSQATHPLIRTSQVSLSSNPDADFRYSTIFTPIGLYKGQLYAIKTVRKKSIDITREMKKELKLVSYEP